MRLSTLETRVSRRRYPSIIARTTLSALLVIGGFNTQGFAASNKYWVGRNPGKGSEWFNNGNQNNWGSTATSPADVTYSNGDAVFFTNSGTQLTISVTENVTPFSMEVSNDTSHNYTFSGSSITATGSTGTFTKNGLGTVTFNNIATFAGTASINGGTLEIGSAGSFTSSNITVNNGGTLLLSGSNTTSTNRIADNQAITLDGGAVKISGTSEILGALTLSATSSLDFSGTASSLTFSSITTASSGSSFTLNIYHWDSGDHLYLNQAPSSNITFNFYDNTNQKLNNVSYEVVPEPSTVLAGIGLVGLVGWRERRRIASLLKKGRCSASLQTA